MSTRRRQRLGRLGLRREVVILLPAAFVLLAVVALSTLVAYRGAVTALVDERQAEAVALARAAAAELALSAAPDDSAVGAPAAPAASAVDLAARLARQVPGAVGAALVDADGRVRARHGRLPPGDPLAPLPAWATAADAPEPVAVGPTDGGSGAAGVGDRVAAFAPLGPPERRSWVRVDLAAPVLAAERARLGRLSWVVGGTLAALGVLVLLFAGRLLAPYEALLERARAARLSDDGSGGTRDGTGGEPDDEVAFLVETFERALAARDRSGDVTAVGRTLAASFASGVLVLDRDGRLLAANSEASSLLGLSAPGPSSLVPPGARTSGTGGAPAFDEVLSAHPALSDLVRQALAEEQAVRRREVALTGASGPLTLGVTVHPLRHPDGEVRGYLVQFADLTEARRRAERARLADNLRQLGELSAGVAHELRNSLATLRGHLELAGRDLAGTTGAVPAGVHESLDEMRREAEHLERVLEDFLDFARPGTVRPETVDLGELAGRAAADPALGDARVRVDAPPGAVLTGDPQLLERLLRNLLRNAAEAAGREPIEVAVERAPDGIALTVADRGTGVPAAVRERLFLPFASGRAGGVGLGLALAQRIALLHGGRLRLDDRPGGGTVARLELPAGESVTEGNDPVEPPDDFEPPPEAGKSF